MRLVYPLGYFYGEEGCKPYWTNEPVKPFSKLCNEETKEESER